MDCRRRAHFDAVRDERAPVRMKVGDDATIGDIVRTKLGRELCYQFVEPMLGGIQAGRIDDLSAKSVFPALLDAARKGGSLMRALRASAAATPGPSATSTNAGPTFYSLLAGVGSLPLELARQLRARGVVLRTGVAVTALRRTPSGNYPWEVDTPATTTPADAVVMATPAPVTARLLGRARPGARDARRRAQRRRGDHHLQRRARARSHSPRAAPASSCRSARRGPATDP